MDGEKLSYNDMGLKNDQWVFMETRNGVSDTESNGSTCDEDSILSSSSSDIQEEDDATSSSTSSSNSGPLFELSQLMDHLPIKYVIICVLACFVVYYVVEYIYILLCVLMMCI